MVTFKWNKDGLEKLQKKIETLNGRHEVAVEDLFHPGFMRLHSRFKNIEEMIAASGIKVTDVVDLNGNSEWDDFVKQNTEFASWSDMKTAAITNWTQNQFKK